MELDHLMRAQSHGGSFQSLPESHGTDVPRQPAPRRGSESHPLKSQPLVNERPIIADHTREKQSAKTPTVKLRRSWSIVVVVLLYVILAVWTWATLVILSSRPLTTKSYGYDGNDMLEFNTLPTTVHALYQKNEQYFQAARFLGPVLAVLAIPVTSAVCTKAAAAYMKHASARRLTLRQSLTLADRGWTDPLTCLRLFTGEYKRYGTIFLLGAMILTILGASVFPLQSYFVTSAVIKTPTQATTTNSMIDILDNFPARPGLNDDLLVLQTREALTSTNTLTAQGRLWSRNPHNCNVSLVPNQYPDQPWPCFQGDIATFGNLSSLEDPFIAQPTPGYSTGLIRQFLPRINSSVHRQEVQASEYPTDCQSRPGAFWVHYGSTTQQSPAVVGWGSWSLDVCMPANQTHSPWHATRARQDFSEVLYLNISLTSTGPESYFETPQEQGGLFKITMNTSAGYFELPNYMNGQMQGDLLDTDPVDACLLAPECATQGTNTNEPILRREFDDVQKTTNESLSLERLFNKGPLLTVTLALFGTGSFIAERMRNPEAFFYPNTTWNAEPPNYDTCVDQAPLFGLLTNTLNQAQIGNDDAWCLTNTVKNHDNLQRQIVNWILALYWNTWDGYAGERIQNAWTAAAFISNEQWLMSSAFESVNMNWGLSYDYGADSLKPVISPSAKLGISVLLGIFLSALLGLALYAACTPRWTDDLDGFALVRLGAAMSGDLRLRVAHGQDGIAELDRLPGWVGDATNGEGPVGELGVGVGSALRRGREYIAYDALATGPVERFETEAAV